MEYQEPTESGLAKGTVDNLASSIAAQFGYEPGADLTPIVEKMGGTILIQDILASNLASSGSIKVEAEGNFQIYLAAHTGPTRDRFTIAHEIGHYVLHYIWPNRNGKVIERLVANRYGTGRVEWEANWFAAGFLMPAAAFKQKANETNRDASLLALHFGVSVEAARVRLNYFGLA